MMSRIGLILVILIYAVVAKSQDVVQPTLMVIPSDNLLDQLGCLNEQEVDGRVVYMRDYQRAFVKQSNLKFVISAINERFAEIGYPLQSLEQTLKSLNTRRAVGSVSGFDQDPKSAILKTARPDIIIDLTYDYKDKGMSGLVTFNIEAIDAYSNTSVASATHDGAGVETINKGHLESILAEQVENNMQNFQSLMHQHFQDLRSNGRIISLRCVSEGGAIANFRRDKCGDTPIARWLDQWLKRNTVNGVVTRGLNAPTEMGYTVRIPLYGEDGYAYTASDFVYKLADALDASCGRYTYDDTQGLGDAVLVFSN